MHQHPIPPLPRLLLLLWSEVPTPGHTHHGHGEANQHHEEMVDHHEELLVQVGADDGAQRPGAGRLVPFDLVLVPVAQEHGVDVVDEVGDGKLGVGGGQPVPAEGERMLGQRKVVSKTQSWQ